MKNNRLGLVISHLHVRPNEHARFEMLDYVIQDYKKIHKNLFIVVSGHGDHPPESIVSQVDEIYWENKINHKEIGVGHPHFCIKSYEILKTNNVERLIKTRFCDLIGNKKLLLSLTAENSNMIFTEQTCLERKMIGDLFMIGHTDKILQLYAVRPWDYSKSGLYNLFDNMTILAEKENKNIKDFLNTDAKFVDPESLKWFDISSRWDSQKLTISQPLTENDLWGKSQNYPYYGGF